MRYVVGGRLYILMAVHMQYTCSMTGPNDAFCSFCKEFNAKTADIKVSLNMRVDFCKLPSHRLTDQSISKPSLGPDA